MRKVSKSLHINIPPLRLFLDDLFAIEKVYKKHFQSYKILTDQCEFSSVKELHDNIKAEKINQLSFKRVSFSPDLDIVIDFSKKDADIYSYYDDEKSRGIVSILKEILKKRIILRGYLTHNRVLLIFYTLLGVLLGVFSRNTIVNQKIKLIILIVVSLLFISIFYFSILGARGHTVIYLKEKITQKNFFNRNKDQILLSLLNLIISGLIGYPIAVFTNE